MIFLFLIGVIYLIGAVVITFYTMPAFLAWICLFFGGLTVVSRSLAWLTGRAQYDRMVIRHHDQGGSVGIKMNTRMEIWIWAIGLQLILMFWLS